MASTSGGIDARFTAWRRTIKYPGRTVGKYWWTNGALAVRAKVRPLKCDERQLLRRLKVRTIESLFTNTGKPVEIPSVESLRVEKSVRFNLAHFNPIPLEWIMSRFPDAEAQLSTLTSHSTSPLYALSFRQAGKPVAMLIEWMNPDRTKV